MERLETQVASPVTPPVTLAVTEYGERTSSTHVLLVHGFPDDQRMWEAMAAALPADWHVITYDLRGSGRSTRPVGRSSYRLELLVEDLIAVLDATLSPGERVHLVGHDWGSIVGWDVVAAETWDPRLEGRLASYTSCSGPPLDHLGSMAESWRGRLRMLPQALRSWYVWLFLLPWLPEQLWAYFQVPMHKLARRFDPTIDLLPWGQDVRRNASRSLDLYRANVVPRLRRPIPWRTSLPVLLVVATRDTALSPATLNGLGARCRDLTRVEVDEGHWVARARPAEFADLVASFVRRHG